MIACVLVLGGLLNCGGQVPEPPNDVPVIPIPIGRPEPPSRSLHFDLSATAPVVRYSRRDPKGGWVEAASNRPTRHRTSGTMLESEFTRLRFSADRASPADRLTAVTLSHEWYLLNAWSATLDVEAARAGARVGVGVTYFPVEGISIRLGVDSRRGVVLTWNFHFDEDYERLCAEVRWYDLVLRCAGVPGDPVWCLLSGAVRTR